MSRSAKITCVAQHGSPSGGDNGIAVLYGAVAVVGDVGRVNRLSIWPRLLIYDGICGACWFASPASPVTSSRLRLRPRPLRLGALTGPHRRNV